MVEPGAAADCERILESWWGQPVNTITATAFLVAAVLIWWHRHDTVTSLLVAAIGLGSIAFHGPMPSWGEFVHDVSIVLTLFWVLLVELKRTHLWPWALALGAGLSVTPAVADPVQALLALAVIGSVVMPRERRKIRMTAVSTLALGGLVGTLSRTGWPWCEPESIWQGHGLWHLAAAATLALWAVAIRPQDRPA